MQKIKNNKCFWLLFFLALFGFSIGTFDNYRELWMAENHLSTVSISRVISISYFVTVLILFYFTIRVSADKLKMGIVVSLLIKMITGTILICLNGTNALFWIKFLMFFDIAFTQVIVASIYPLMMNISKDDVLYTKKSFIESLFSKLGFLFVSILLGKVIVHTIVDYNLCLLLSILFTFLSFFILITIEIENKKAKTKFDLKETLTYFNKNKILYTYLFHNGLGALIWASILGMPMLILTENIGLSSTTASYLILGLGILSNFLSMFIVKYAKEKSDYVHMFFKYGVRLLFYILILFINNTSLFFIMLLYLLLTDCTHEFVFSGFFINNIEEKYSLLLTTLKYCSSLIGKAIGTFICGFVFHFEYRYFVIPAILLSILHYFIIVKLIKEKQSQNKKI